MKENFKLILDKSVEFWGKNRQKFLYGLASLCIFLVGYGTGKARQEFSSSSKTPYNNYSITGEESNQAESSKSGRKLVGEPDSLCPVKGNISAKGNKVYHVSSGRFYTSVKPEECFKTEEEANAAGFKKSPT